MGRAPYSLKQNLNRGAWTAKEDMILTEYVETHGECGWRSLPMKAGLNRCGKSCRLRWLNYLRPNIKRGNISADEEDLIIRLHRLLGNRWSLIAGRLPGRTDNEIKNYWNTHLSKKLTMSGVDPKTHRPLDNAAPTVHSPHTTFPVQNQNSPSESISKECNSNVMQLTLVKNSEDDIAAAFDNAPDTIATGNRPDKPLFVNNNDQVDVSKSWSQLLEGTCAYDDHPNSELIVTRLSDDILVDESCFEAESEYSLSFNIPSVCTSSSSPVGTEFEQSDRLLAISNSTESITRSNDSYSDPDCVPLTDADSIDFRTIEEFCMESLLIETPHQDLEEIYRQLERDDCTDMFYRDVNCFATGTSAEQGMNEIYSNALHLDWTDELLDQYLQRHSTVDPDDPLDHLLESEPEDFWNDGLMLAEQSKTDADSYADIIVDLSF